MIDRTDACPITRQAEALGISRGAVYDEPRATSAFDLALMRRLDALHLERPWLGARGLRKALRAESPGLGRRRIGTLMRLMGIVAMVPQPGTSRRHRGHPVYLYLLRHRAWYPRCCLAATDAPVPGTAAYRSRRQSPARSERACSSAARRSDGAFAAARAPPAASISAARSSPSIWQRRPSGSPSASPVGRRQVTSRRRR